jgi:diguanylate cyclase (GGDEF)-like protein
VDIIGRLGGDEFGVLVVDAITENGSAILSRLEENLNRLNEGNDLYRLSLSIGLIEIDLNNSETIYELIGKADAAMYKRKRKKRRRRSQSNRFPCPEEYCEEFGRVKTPEYLNAV